MHSVLIIVLKPVLFVCLNIKKKDMTYIKLYPEANLAFSSNGIVFLVEQK
ncbi:hypothetical protein C7437_11136 [Psychrobacillus insolitus]|jgi:hypothetical protein|uniref:Uncharacterized protein n=1 Tax=Psychrobacillus insolitus TaxID=1461 RepID=A0A2W7MC45_9BACI|nr:hypothetical protein C7437_11136 [Psychrobacillus insolitus]